MRTLQRLPQLRKLDIGENPGISVPGQRYKLIEALPQLEHLDRRSLGGTDKQLARSFFEAKEKEKEKEVTSAAAAGPEAQPSSAAAKMVEPLTQLRPDTAPAACWRPPPLPGRSLCSSPVGSPLAGSAGGAGVAALSLGPLPGLKLKSARANRMDELLTQSREPSPDPEGGGPSSSLRLAGGDPAETLKLLEVHSVSLWRRLETLQTERENLRFQVRLLERDVEESQPAWLRERIERLELECRSSQAVTSEHDQLQSRLKEVEGALAALESGQAVRQALGGDVEARPTAEPDEEDALEELKMEGRMLEKRLERSQRHVEKLQQEYLRAQLQSSHLRAEAAYGRAASGGPAPDSGTDNADEDPEVTALLAANEARLRQLRDEVRDTATAMARRPAGHRPREPPAEPQEGADVLKLRAGSAGEDLEFHAVLQ